MAFEIEKAILFYLSRGFESSLLNEDIFSFEDNKIIFRKIRELKKNGRLINEVVLAEELSSKGIKPGYIASLHELAVSGTIGEKYFQDHVRQLFREHKEKQIKSLVKDLIGQPDFIPVLKELLADYEPELYRDIKRDSISSITPAFRSFIESKRGSRLWGHEVKSFPVLSKILMGIREITVLAAKPKTGKSTFALQIASDLSEEGIPILFFDFENGSFNLMARQLSRKNSLSFEEIFSDDEDRKVYLEAGLQRLAERENFYIITDRKLTIEKIRNFIKQAKQTAGREEVFIVIDSLQKLPMENLRERRAAVDLWLRGLEELKAEDPGLSILLISELSREGGKPKESGDIEYTAHFSLELQTGRTEEELTEMGDDMIRKLFVKAARDVPVPAGPIKYEADFRYWTFSEMQ